MSRRGRREGEPVGEPMGSIRSKSESLEGGMVEDRRQDGGEFEISDRPCWKALVAAEGRANGGTRSMSGRSEVVVL